MNKLLISYILSFLEFLFWVFIPVFAWLIFKYFLIIFYQLLIFTLPFGIPEFILFVSYVIAFVFIGFKFFKLFCEVSFLFSEYKEKIGKQLKQTENLS